jgi:CheY-like chemotaxis protein
MLRFHFTSAVPESTAGKLAPEGVDPNELLLDRVKEIARGIEGRVRHALNPNDIPIAQLRILVVDDHPDAADSLAAVLELLGCSVRTSYDGPAALTVAAEFDPHVCLLDLMMPTMDGLELGAHLKARAGSHPLLLIATTALGDWESKTRTALAGFHHHLTKPVDIPALVEAITVLAEIMNRPVGEADRRTLGTGRASDGAGSSVPPDTT